MHKLLVSGKHILKNMKVYKGIMCSGFQVLWTCLYHVDEEKRLPTNDIIINQRQSYFCLLAKKEHPQCLLHKMERKPSMQEEDQLHIYVGPEKKLVKGAKELKKLMIGPSSSETVHVICNSKGSFLHRCGGSSSNCSSPKSF